jgi:hypothetical protein
MIQQISLGQGSQRTTVELAQKTKFGSGNDKPMDVIDIAPKK